MKKRILLFGAIAMLGAAIVAGWSTASGADHGDAPITKGEKQLDINDVYVFRGDKPDKVVLAMTVNPLTMPGDDAGFSTDGIHEFKIDNNGDAVPDISYRATFSARNVNKVQNVTVRRTTADADKLNNTGTDVITGTTTKSGDPPAIAESGGVRMFAGLRDDPFFFDLNAFKDSLKFRNPGVDFFKGTNVSIIVLEVAESSIEGGDGKFGVWGVTSRNGGVVDRMGRPAINTVFVPADKKDAFNATKPVNDVSTWKATFEATLTSLGADTALAGALLPDIITVDTGKALNFLNGRAAADDVIDAELKLITGNNAASDFVPANDNPFPTTFPFFAAPNTAPIAATTPAAAATTAAPTAPTTAPPTGVTAPDTGTGDALGDDNGMLAVVMLAIAAAAIVSVASGIAIRARSR